MPLSDPASDATPPVLSRINALPKASSDCINRSSWQVARSFGHFGAGQGLCGSDFFSVFEDLRKHVAIGLQILVCVSASVRIWSGCLARSQPLRGPKE